MRSLATPWFALLALAGLATAQSPLEVSGIPNDAPFAVAARATASELVVDLTFLPEWHAYARDVGGGQPVRLSLDEDSGFRAAGKFVAPDRGDGLLVGNVALSLPIAANGESNRLRATLELQVCDALECLEPMTVRIDGEVASTSLLLVVAERGPRSERITTFLTERGFDVAVDTYTDVTAEACEARDVVIADSGLFREHGVGLDVVRGFPRSSTPLIAVGFLGTVLVEAHGLAMTSGYI